jgi:hypothetical protein
MHAQRRPCDVDGCPGAEFHEGEIDGCGHPTKTTGCPWASKSDTIETLIARAPGSVLFGPAVAARLVGQRVTIDRSGPEVATIIRTWLSADRCEVHGEVDFDHTAVGEAARSIVAEGQASPFDAMDSRPAS